jgi:hypothetical protein
VSNVEANAARKRVLPIFGVVRAIELNFCRIGFGRVRRSKSTKFFTMAVVRIVVSELVMAFELDMTGEITSSSLRALAVRTF